MPFECITTATQVQFFGNVFVPKVESTTPVVVDGDLICEELRAPKLTLMHGSLICPKIECPELHAEILGVFDVTQPFEKPFKWSYMWLRPILSMPLESQWSNEISIANAAAIFEHPATIGDARSAKKLIARVRSRATCMRARVLFETAVEELVSTDFLQMTPLGQQVVLDFSAHGIPQHWRF